MNHDSTYKGLKHIAVYIILCFIIILSLSYLNTYTLSKSINNVHDINLNTYALSKLINKVYVINLKKCTDRKAHIVKEFSRVGITKYEFFDAVDKDNQTVTDMMNNGFVKKFPPCFRCNKNSCDCSNNILIKSQIGNWCSYINLMNHIIKTNHHGLIMICEDDIKFTDNGVNTLNKLLTDNNFKKYNIDLNKPVLLRIGCGYSTYHESRMQPCFVKNITMSNPCFIINVKYAISFINNLKKIDMTSDTYMHEYLVTIDKSIQSYSVMPIPVYELSCGKFKQFPSEIHPKGLNDDDIARAKTHFKRVEYKKFLCIGHPRCGTGSISHYLTQMGYNVEHENMGTDGTSSWMMAVNDDNYPYGNIQDKYRYYFENIIHIVRNPIDAIPSVILEHKYSPGNKSYGFKRKHIKNILNIDLPDVDFNNIDLRTELELAIKCFIYWNKICANQNPNITCKIEDISPLNIFNHGKRKINTVQRNSNKKYSGMTYIKPHIDQIMYKNISSDLKAQLNNFCKQYNYNTIIPNDSEDIP